MKGLYIRQLIAKNNKLEFEQVLESELESSSDDKPILFAIRIDRETVEKGRV